MYKLWDIRTIILHTRLTINFLFVDFITILFHLSKISIYIINYNCKNITFTSLRIISKILLERRVILTAIAFSM